MMRCAAVAAGQISGTEPSVAVHFFPLIALDAVADCLRAPTLPVLATLNTGGGRGVGHWVKPRRWRPALASLRGA